MSNLKFSLPLVFSGTLIVIALKPHKDKNNNVKNNDHGPVFFDNLLILNQFSDPLSRLRVPCQ